MENVFLITVDDLRADHVGYINNKYHITPNLDKFAERYISFKNAIATGPRTTLSFPSILYSLYASEYFNHERYKRSESLATILKELNYNTSSFNSNPHFKIWGFSKGFDLFEDFCKITISKNKNSFELLKQKLVKKFGIDSIIVKNLSKIITNLSMNISLPYTRAKETTDICLEWLRENKDSQIFCWLHYMDPHYPFIPPKNFLKKPINNKIILKVNRLYKSAENYRDKISNKNKKILIELYETEISYFDKYFGEFIEGLKKIDLFNESIIIFTSDHGELFGDYGRFGHNYDVLYQKQLHVPLIIKTPDEKRKKIERPVSLIDIPNTIMEIIDINNSIFYGTNIWKNKREYIISEGFKRPSLPSEQKKMNRERNWENKIIISCQKDNMKLIIDEIHNRKELYNLENDPEESNNLYNYEEYGKIKYDLEQKIFNHKEKIIGFKVEKKLIKNKIQKLKKSGKI